MEGIRRRGRPRRRWLDEITKKLGRNLESALKLATNMKEWRKATMKSPEIKIDLTDDDDTVSIIEITDALLRNERS